jgi:hypothetical protein
MAYMAYATLGPESFKMTSFTVFNPDVARLEIAIVGAGVSLAWQSMLKTDWRQAWEDSCRH